MPSGYITTTITTIFLIITILLRISFVTCWPKKLVMLLYILHHFNFLTNEGKFIWKNNCTYQSPNLTCLVQSKFYYICLFWCLVTKCYASCSQNFNHFLSFLYYSMDRNSQTRSFFYRKLHKIFLAVSFSVAVKFFAEAITLLVVTFLWNCGEFWIDVSDSVYLNHTWSV